MALPIYTHIPNLKGLTKIFFKLSRPKGNLCGSGGVTVPNPKYPQLSSGDTMTITRALRECIHSPKPNTSTIAYEYYHIDNKTIHCPHMPISWALSRNAGIVTTEKGSKLKEQQGPCQYDKPTELKQESKIKFDTQEKEKI